jgi:hypothetical protein
MFSETHIFPTPTNEFRVGFNDIRAQRLQFNAANTAFAASIGFGGIPVGYLNGGIPAIQRRGIQHPNFGSGGYSPGKEKENVYQIIDNVIKIVGNHALKAGVNFLSMRFSTLGIAYSPDNNISIRAGYGLFYGGLENAGYMPNLGQNYPFQFDSNFPSGNCSATSCPTG